MLCFPSLTRRTEFFGVEKPCLCANVSMDVLSPPLIDPWACTCVAQKDQHILETSSFSDLTFLSFGSLFVWKELSVAASLRGVWLLFKVFGDGAVWAVQLQQSWVTEILYWIQTLIHKAWWQKSDKRGAAAFCCVLKSLWIFGWTLMFVSLWWLHNVKGSWLLSSCC